MLPSEKVAATYWPVEEHAMPLTYVLEGLVIEAVCPAYTEEGDVVDAYLTALEPEFESAQKKMYSPVEEV